MAKKTPTTGEKESAKKEKAAAKKEPAKKEPAKPQKPAAKKASAKKPAVAEVPEPTDDVAEPAPATKTKAAAKKGSATKAAPVKAAKSPAPRKEPTSDSVIIVNGIAELVRLGLGAMDPDQRETLLVALAKVGASMAKNR